MKARGVEQIRVALGISVEEQAFPITEFDHSPTSKDRTSTPPCLRQSQKNVDLPGSN